MNPNSFDKEIQDAQQGANPQTPNQGTEGAGTPVTTPSANGEGQIDYKVKFAESSKEALRLLEERKAKDAEIERLRKELEAKANGSAPSATPVTESLYPGFEQLDPEAQQNLIAYTNSIKAGVVKSVYEAPEIKFAREQYNTSRWEQAFNAVAEKYPELKTDKDGFKSKYFKADNVPDNISTILEDVAKIHLFDKAKDLGAEEERKKLNRVDLERTSGGEKAPTATRTLEEWSKMQQTNPAKFASLAKEYNADLAAGRL